PAPGARRSGARRPEPGRRAERAANRAAPLRARPAGRHPAPARRSNPRRPHRPAEIRQDRALSWEPGMPSEKILVVDDSRDARDMIANYILQPNGYTILAADNLLSALELARS